MLNDDLSQIFDNYFEIRIARTKQDIEKAHRLRYQVYCVESNFEDPADFPDGLERDAFDAHSIHALLTYVPANLVIGTVRLVLPDAHGRGLPCQAMQPSPLRYLSEPFDPATSGEVSRYAIARTFRRRVGEDRYPDVGWEYDAEAIERRVRRALPNLSLALFRGIVAMSQEYGVNTVFAVADPVLLRLVGRFGVEFNHLGPLVDYHGRRQPCFARMDELCEAMVTHRPELWNVVKPSGIDQSPAIDMPDTIDKPGTIDTPKVAEIAV